MKRLFARPDHGDMRRIDWIIAVLAIVLLLAMAFSQRAEPAEAHYLHAADARSALRGNPGDDEVGYFTASGSREYFYYYNWEPDCYHVSDHDVRCAVHVNYGLSGWTTYWTKSYFPNSTTTIYDKWWYTQ